MNYDKLASQRSPAGFHSEIADISLPQKYTVPLPLSNTLFFLSRTLTLTSSPLFVHFYALSLCARPLNQLTLHALRELNTDHVNYDRFENLQWHKRK
jgi:hypothetical protein